MLTLLGRWSQQIWLAVIWSIITQVLLSLPGSIFPGRGLFSLPHLDKIAHLGLFSGLVFCWGLFSYFRKRPPSLAASSIWMIVLVVFLYGVFMEFIQKNFIPNRSFDSGDIVADLVGSLIGYILTHWFIRRHGKHKPYKIN